MCLHSVNHPAFLTKEEKTLKINENKKNLELKYIYGFVFFFFAYFFDSSTRNNVLKFDRKKRTCVLFAVEKR